MLRYLKKSASVQDRLRILTHLKAVSPSSYSTPELAYKLGIPKARMSILLYELANQGHIARRFKSSPTHHALFTHIPGYEFDVYKSKSKPRPNQKRKAKSCKTLLEQAWRTQ